MKINRGIVISLILLAGITILAYLWATSLMNSLYAFRSPLADITVKAGQPIGAPLARRVVSIMIDGLRVDTAANPAVMPFLNNLRTRGASAAMHSGLPSYSVPGWSVLAIGAWPDLSDAPAMNPTSAEGSYFWTQDNIYADIRHAGLHSAVAANDYFEYLIPPAAIDAAGWTHEENPAADQQNIDTAVKFIQSGQYQYIFTYMVQVDHAGHYEGGPLDPRWNQAAARCDRLLQQIVAALDLDQDTVLIYSDHGHLDRGGHGGQESVVLMEPFLIVGANVRPGVYPDMLQVDVAPTTAALLGVSIPAIAQGHVLTDMLNLTPAQQTAVRRASGAQQTGLYQAYAGVMGVPANQITISAGQEPVAIYQEAMLAIKNGRLNRDRLLRFLWVIPLAVLPGLLLYRNRTRSLVWILAGAGLYLALFHLLYAWLGGGTYSMSSVLSAASLILITALQTSLAFAIAWLVVFLGLRLYSLPRSQAVHLHLVFAFTTLYIIALPILWSAGYNGLLVGWTLPEMASMFLGFLSILQALFVAALSLVLVGVSSLYSR